ncbi:2-dehydro-3-deoxy-6-phosphogalactonate aldolase [Brenneria roseae subsp. roseae]|uniref:2-dehydro-3-deoxy-6-phosphogalactonate aldolase n=1 Tax=Brenneria roseae TaxID=1509241 RepID=UPI000D608042|nr:2-dehydro-3-deoxy-6-phosphogalactonate aldolase [Brenneria roseae]PWC22300.1 2-dehydro-3-deoxy-6-phosphogalactonate aldolase [Brenneria roseae subsp. roseae]
MDFLTTLRQTGLIAILRGITPDEVEDIGRQLYQAGFRIIEIPLNSPEPLRSIARLRQALPQDCRVGAGTVMSANDVRAVKQNQGEIIISPHTDPAVIQETRKLGLISLPGAATPSEAFSALSNGAHGVKIFPAEAVSPQTLKAWRAVIPAEIPLLPVGGITAESLSGWLAAGASGFGIGGMLYKPGMSPESVGENAAAFVRAWRTSHA